MQWGAGVLETARGLMQHTGSPVTRFHSHQHYSTHACIIKTITKISQYTKSESHTISGWLSHDKTAFLHAIHLSACCLSFCMRIPACGVVFYLDCFLSQTPPQNPSHSPSSVLLGASYSSCDDASSSTYTISSINPAWVLGCVGIITFENNGCVEKQTPPTYRPCPPACATHHSGCTVPTPSLAPMLLG